MEPIDVIILIAAVLIVGGVIARAIVLKKRGKSIGCDCGSCSGSCGKCGACPSQQGKKK